MRIDEFITPIPVRLAPQLQESKAQYEAIVLRAQARLARFAETHGWLHLLKEPIAQSARIYSDKSSFDEDLLELLGMNPDLELPSTYVAALENGILVAVSPEIYQAVYPEGDEPDSYEKLLTHEMAHRFHIRILKGNENAMGPIWFFEGFALYAAGQFERLEPTLDRSAILAITSKENREDYRLYASVFRFFASRIPVSKLVTFAGEHDDPLNLGEYLLASI